MKTKKPYNYIVLRYVHDVVTGEFVNVGILLVSPNENKVLARTRKTIGRIKSVFPDLDRTSFVDTMKAFDTGFRKVSKIVAKNELFASQKDAGDYALQILPHDDSSLQWSSVGAGLTGDVEQTFERLFERFVSRYDTSSPSRKSDEDVWRPVKAMLAERGVDLELETKVVKGTSDSIEFSRAWKNGRWHVYEPLSFDLADADKIKDKARRWRGHLAAVAEGTSDEVHLNFLIGKPENRSLLDAYNNALDILKGSKFTPSVFEESNIEDFVNEIEDEFREHQKQ